MIPLLLSCLLIAFPASLPSQESEGEDQPPRVSVAELVVGQYEPKNVSIEALEDLVEDMAGRYYYVAERGGYQSEPVSNIDYLGDNLIVYDTQDNVARVLDLCATLDRAPSAQPPEGLTTFEYRPSYITLDGAYSALSSFQRNVRSDEDDAFVPNLAPMQERGLLVVRDTGANVAEMRGLLQRIDVPREQILITCYLLSTAEPGAEASGLTLPPDLVSHLRQLLPTFQLAPIGFSMVRSSVAPDAQMRIEIWTTNRAQVYHLELAPSAFDSASGSLTVDRCVLDVAMGGNTNARVEVFSTSAIFRGGEYTVLGATGVKPVFLVVHVATVR